MHIVIVYKWNFRNYEDSVQRICGFRIKADRIITGNIRNFAEGKGTALMPAEFLEEV